MALYMQASTWYMASETCRIQTAETRDGVTFYNVEVHVSPHSWVVKHRYSDFSDLHDKLVDLYQLDRSLLPPKKLFGRHSEAFICKRQIELELYLQTLIHRFTNLPLCLREFLDFPKYEIRTIIENLCEVFYSQGDMILASDKPYCFSTLEIHAIDERLKLAEPTCLTGKKKHDLGHLLSFVTQLKHLEIVGKSLNLGVSNIVPNNLPFTLAAFKSLQSLKFDKVNMEKLLTVEHLNKTLTQLTVQNTLDDLCSILLCGNIHWHPQDPISQWPFWKSLTSVDFSHNSLTSIHPCIKLLPAVEKINLSYNHIHEIENLESLPRLSVLDLSCNKIKQLPPLHTRLGNVRALILTGNKIECLQGLSRLFSLTELQLESNCIVALSEIEYIGKLPCLEKLSLCGNPISNSVDYRSNVLLTFGTRASEVTLDDAATTEKEMDTIAVLQALQIAKKEQLSDASQQICPAGKRKQGCHHVCSCSEFKCFQRLRHQSDAVSRFRQEVAVLKKLGGSNWLRLLNQVLSKSSQVMFPDVSNEVCDNLRKNIGVMNPVSTIWKAVSDQDPIYQISHSYIAFSEKTLSLMHSNDFVKEYLEAFVTDDIKRKMPLSSMIDFFWLIYVVHQCISIAQIPVCMLLFISHIIVFKLESSDNICTSEADKYSVLQNMSCLKSFSSCNVSSFVIGPRKAYFELHISEGLGVCKHLFFVPNSYVAEHCIQKFQEVYNFIPVVKKNPFANGILDLEALKSNQNYDFGRLQGQLLFCERVILHEVSYCWSSDAIHYLSITPSHIILIEEMLPFVLHPEFHICTVVGIHAIVQNIYIGRDNFLASSKNCNLNKLYLCAKESVVPPEYLTEGFGPFVFIQFDPDIIMNIRFLCFSDQSNFLNVFSNARSM